MRNLRYKDYYTSMAKFFLLIFLSIASIDLQGRSIESWRSHLGYSVIADLMEVDDYIIANGTYGVVFYNKTSGEKEVLDKISGLSEVVISKIAYDETSKNLVIAYASGNIDVINFSNGRRISNLPDIKNKTIYGNKTIYNITFYNGLCYLSTGIGIIVVDLVRNEIKATYKIGDNGEALAVYSIVFFNNQIIAGCANGIKNASMQALNLQSFSNWKRDYEYNLSSKSINKLIVYNGKLMCVESDSIIHSLPSNNWVRTFRDTNYLIGKCKVINQSFYAALLHSGRASTEMYAILEMTASSPIELKYKNSVRFNLDIVITKEGDTIIAGLGGFNKIIDGQVYKNEINGCSISTYSLNIDREILYVSGGMPKDENYTEPTFNKTGLSTYYGSYWESASLFTSGLESVYDNLSSEIYGSKAYLSLFVGGLAEIEGANVKIYDGSNSIIDWIPADKSTRVVDVHKDKKGNLWVLNHQSLNPLIVLTKEGNWRKFTISNSIATCIKFFIDSKGNKWIALKGRGLIVYNEGNNIDDPSDDKFIAMNFIKDKCEISDQVRDFAEDKNGGVWVATSRGVQIFNCGSNLFEGGCKPYSPLITKGDGKQDPNDTFPECLLNYENVKAIAVDGGNRKWCGTTSGAYLISADGKKELKHYTKDNSPLPSNEINDIAIHPKTGEVFIATALGLVSVVGDATEGREFQDTALFIYPNPIARDYEGVIAIDNLVGNAGFKITDLSGNLVYEGKANGGRAIWSGKKYNGERPHSGVYFVFTSDELGNESARGKIVIEY